MTPEASRWTDANRANWDARARAHLADPGSFYDFGALRAGESSLLPLERELLGEVRDRRMLHLMCHLGLDSISWARLGARVTAVDLSPESIAGARRLAVECGVAVDFIVGDILALPPDCDGPFDVIVMTYGVLCWVRDVPGLLRVVAQRLVAGGRFLLIDGHPVVDQITAGADGPHLLPTGYFHDPRPEHNHSETSYTGNARLAHGEDFQWGHHLGEIVQATAGAGLRVRDLRELPLGFYRRYPGMTRRADGYWDPPAGWPMLPFLFALVATRDPA